MSNSPSRMSNMQCFFRLGLWALIALGTQLAPVGCKEERAPFEDRNLEGKIVKIQSSSDSTGEITVVYTDHGGRETTGTGRVTPQTEIMINGALAHLSDVQEGERVCGVIRVDRRNKNHTPVVLKMEVDRARLIARDEGAP